MLPKFYVMFFSEQAKLSVWEHHYYVCVHTCVWFPWESAGSTYTEVVHLVLINLTICLLFPSNKNQFLIRATCVPNLHKLPPLGFRCLWESLGALLIAIRIRNVPAQIIHINNWNKRITLYTRLTATPRTKLTVYKNSYVKNLHKRQTKKEFSVQTFTEKKIKPTQHMTYYHGCQNLLLLFVISFHCFIWDNSLKSCDSLVEWTA